MDEFLDTMRIKVKHTESELRQIAVNLVKEIEQNKDKELDTQAVLKISSSVPRPLTRIRSNIHEAKQAAADPITTKISDLIGDIFT